MADGRGHSLMTKAAYQALPDWEHALWDAELESLAGEYCMYGDSYFGSGRQVAAPYMEMPNGENPMAPWTLRTFTKKEFGDFFRCGYYDQVRYVLEYYVASIAGTLKEGKTRDAAKFAGVLAHFIEDSSCPPHALGTELSTDLYLIKRLMPAPCQRKRVKNFHTILESEYESFSLSGYVPRLMGTTPAEASFLLLERFADMVETSIEQILSMVTAFYDDEPAELRRRLTTTAIQASEMLADALHTAACIAFQQFENEALDAISEVRVNRLTAREQTGWAPYPYNYPEIRNSNVSLADGYEPVDLSLNVDGDPLSFSDGFGIGAPFHMTYSIPVGTYRSFKSFIGLHPELNGDENAVVFEVLLDGHVAYNSGEIRNHNARGINVELKEARVLTLSTESCNGDKFTSSGQAVWGSPRLEK